ncbi:MAG TPA: membrane protein insertase YidC [Burkholderiales bacterium]|jgi:YidC/Oxa1 family membrane protein insertase|nr:membrane protein insertase YidC [Burkholderiales bacterium]
MDSLRLFAAMIFAVSVFLLFDAWVKERNPQPAAPLDTARQAVTATPSPTLPPGTTTPQSPAAPPKAVSSSATLPVITVRTDVLSAEIDPVGGVLRRLEFTQHKDKVDKNRNFVLFEQSADHTYVAQSGLIGENLPNHTTVYRSEASNYQLGDGSDELTITLTAPEMNRVAVTKRITFQRGSYLIKEAFQIINGASDEMKPFAYFQFLRDGKPAAGDSKMVPTYTGAAVYTDQSKFRKVTFGDIDKGKTDYPRHVNDGWIAFVQHYFVAAWLPPGETPREFYTRVLGNGLYAAGVIVPADSIAPRASGRVDMRLYAGPQEQEKLATLAPRLELTVDYGWLTVIAAPLFWVLSAIHKWVNNWGAAIIILTVIIKLIFYPLSAASYKSMAKMRVLGPKMQKLKEQYGDDRQRMQQAMIEMYKTEKINPLGGCLPIVVQIPVFIALYWVLLASVELRNAPFMLWITDLSAQDPYYILPVLMGITMIIQTSLNPTPPDPVQAKVMKIMPVVFSVFFFFFPAGLVLYWLVNNILSIAQQWQITRALERSKPAHAPR